ncbi:hypothetical protein C8R47DRAFT_394936 [Mycena vitilis]|nr:hypothetical protein C8R47DRAFT_394936 [Mycena vitilis]
MIDSLGYQLAFLLLIVPRLRASTWPAVLSSILGNCHKPPFSSRAALPLRCPLSLSKQSQYEVQDRRADQARGLTCRSPPRHKICLRNPRGSPGTCCTRRTTFAAASIWVWEAYWRWAWLSAVLATSKLSSIISSQ